jgi:hypothetical protein
MEEGTAFFADHRMSSLPLPMHSMSIRYAVNHLLESRVRETRTHGSEGGEPG